MQHLWHIHSDAATDFLGYHLYLKSIVLISREAMVEVEGPTNFKFNTSTLLEKALKALLSQ